MKPSPYHSFLAIAAVIVFYTNVPIYLNVEHGIGLPWFWVIGFTALAIPVVFTQITKAGFLDSPVMLWCLVYLWLALLGFFWSSQPDEAWQEVRWRVLTILNLVVFLALLAHPDINKLTRQVLVVGVLLGTAINIYELFVPMSFSLVVGRSAGLYMNATTSALALVGGMIFAIGVLPTWFHGSFVLLTGVGVFLTFSRGGILTWLAALAGLIFTGKMSIKHVLLTSALGVLLAGALVLPRLGELLSTLNMNGVINKNVAERLEWLTDPFGVSDDSGAARQAVAAQAWDKFAESPIFGSGTGSFRNAFFIPPHNQFLSFMVDHGIVGAAILPMLLLAISWRKRGEARAMALVFSLVLIMAGFMSHTVMNEPQTLLLCALLATLTDPSPKIRRVNQWFYRGAARRGFGQVESQQGLIL
jgi:O-antigen ligase